MLRLPVICRVISSRRPAVSLISFLLYVPAASCFLYTHTVFVDKSSSRLAREVSSVSGGEKTTCERMEAATGGSNCPRGGFLLIYVSFVSRLIMRHEIRKTSFMRSSFKSRHLPPCVVCSFRYFRRPIPSLGRSTAVVNEKGSMSSPANSNTGSNEGRQNIQLTAVFRGYPDVARRPSTWCNSRPVGSSQQNVREGSGSTNGARGVRAFPFEISPSKRRYANIRTIYLLVVSYMTMDEGGQEVFLC